MNSSSPSHDLMSASSTSLVDFRTTTPLTPHTFSSGSGPVVASGDRHADHVERQIAVLNQSLLTADLGVSGRKEPLLVQIECFYEGARRTRIHSESR